MTSFLRSDRSRAVAIWLLITAALVVAMVVVGGLTRLTGSGLSITQWKPVSGVLPPLGEAQWQAEFARYRAIPQFRFVNPDMSLAQFRFIYFWEWSHRLLARLVGAVFLIPLIWFAVRREIPRRLFVQMGGVILLLGLEPIVGWWMVASGLANRVYVAPERLMIHLGIAFALLGALVWTALDALAGQARQVLPSPWGGRALAVVGLIYLQILLGALVAGNQAGLVYNDWPLFAGHLTPQDYAGADLWATVAHSQGAVQLHHRLVAYLLTLVAGLMGAAAWRSSYLAGTSKLLALSVAILVLVQAGLGIATLMARVPIGLAAAHQLVAALTLCLAVAFAWRVRRI
ncbi:MAG TPA: COX15/CtaA family protein [Phenylobacterium sp.]|jgi:cytochrome c oxidase assembly protein subunit 15|uniref:COX15/CtaA family protein n=1 Tax=Phenylobacterium sp. TaxID=1871053 RepID=UPI002C44B623|nr:COX15/CtaA family protein [Phenylobacterium sp.]HXA39740.1 COX15/CtaA family protein [Phenylobacterium sp.]